MKDKKTLLLENSELFALDSSEFGLKNVEFNRKLTKKLVSLSKLDEIERYSRDRILYKIKNRYVLISHEINEILYYLSYKQKFVSFIGSLVSQEILHWKNRSQYMAGLSRISDHVFLDLLLLNTGHIMSSNLHTVHSRYFWEKLTYLALDRNLLVRYLNLIQDQTGSRYEVQILDKESLQDVLIDFEIWGDGNKFQARRLLISNKIEAQNVRPDS